MATALRNWLSGASLFPATSDAASDEVTIQEPADDGDDGEETEKEDDDQPPAFPAVNSAQRASSSATIIPAILSASPPPSNKTTGLMLPPMPNAAFGTRTLGITPAAARASGNTLMLPPSTAKPPTKAREKVALAPGFGPLDWANLKSSGADLRATGNPGLLRISPSELKQHRKRDDCWSAFNGKVYNITSYLPYHPGGEKELLRVAGRDGTSLFMSTHAWVNAEYMLDACLIGFLV